MCLITTQKRAKIAKDDMTVYKLLESDLRSPYTRFQYERNRLYKTAIRQSICWGGFDEMDSGYYDKHFPGWEKGMHKEVLRCFGEGFHAATTKARLANHFHEEVMYSCIVPKGSRYYEDETGLIVSNQIIIKRKVKV